MQVTHVTVSREQKQTDKIGDSYRSIQSGTSITVALDAGDEARLDEITHWLLEWSRGVAKATILPVVKKDQADIASVYLGLPQDALLMMGLDPDHLQRIANEAEETVTLEHAAPPNVTDVPAPSKKTKGEQ